MNALQRFYAAGAEAADRRVGAALAPPPLEAADRYLKASRLVAAIDGITLRLQEWWLSSEAKRWSSRTSDRIARESLAERRQAVALLILIAVTVHVGLTLLQGGQTGWLWTIIPAMAGLFAIAVLAVSGTAGSAD